MGRRLDTVAMKERSNSRWLFATAAAIAFTIGYFVADDSSEIDRLQSEITKLHSDLAQFRSQPTPILPARRRAPLVMQSPDRGGANEEPNKPKAIPLSLSEFSRQREALLLSNMVSQTAAGSAEGYSTLFGNLGLSTPDTERFKSNLVALHKSAIDAGQLMEKLMRERYEYDKNIRAALGEENYQIYRNYEDSKPAVREYVQFQEFAAKQKNIELDPAYAGEIIQLIKNAGATTTEAWHGPFDPAPRPLVGQEAALKQLTASNEEIKTKSGALIERAKQQVLPAGYTDLIAEYYSAKMRENIATIEKVSQPMESLQEFIREKRVSESKRRLSQP